MPNRARRTKGWCKPMATAALPKPEEEVVPPVKNLCERLGPQRGPQLHSRSQEQILHLILAKRPRRYEIPVRCLYQYSPTLPTPSVPLPFINSYKPFLKESKGLPHAPLQLSRLSYYRPANSLLVPPILRCPKPVSQNLSDQTDDAQDRSEEIAMNG